MDLKFSHGKILLHINDHCTRLLASTVISNKYPDTIIKAIFKIWISVYGSAEKFLTDNDSFIQLCENFGITVKTTAAESTWSNGLVERHNLILSGMLYKILHENNCDFDLALAWAINAKNSLSNIHGFLPYQLSIGTNPKLPSLHLSKAPAITSPPTHKTIIKNVEALHKAREAFIASENSEKLRRALSYNITTSGDIKYFTGDSVYFKRLNSNQRYGPAKVLGQDGQQVLVKNGSSYHHIHPCRLRLINNPPQANNLSQSNKHNNTYPFNDQSISTENKQPAYDTDSESSDDLENSHNIELMPSYSSHSSENPTQLSHPSENSIQQSYQPEFSSQSSHPFETTRQCSHSPVITTGTSKTKYITTIFPINKKVKTTLHHKIQT